MISLYLIIWAIFIGDLLILAFHVMLRHTSILVRSGLGIFITGITLSLLRVCTPLESFRTLYTIEYPASFLGFIPSQYFLQQHCDGVITLILVLLFISVLLIINYLCYVNRLENVLEKNSEIDEESRSLLCEIDQDCPLPVRRSALIKDPILIGYFHMVIYLPCSNYSTEDLRNILLHEYTHWKHHHSFIKFYVHLSTLLMWWNPFIHIFERDLSHILELICDEAAMSAYSEKHKISYFSTIFRCLQKEQGFSWHPTIEDTAMPHLVSIGKKPLVLQRYEYLLKREKRMGHLSNILSCLGVICFFLLTYCVVVQPIYTPDKVYHVNSDLYSNPDNSYLVESKDGSYTFYYNSEPIEVDSEDILAGYYDIYPVISYKEYASSGDYTDSETYRKYVSQQETP